MLILEGLGYIVTVRLKSYRITLVANRMITLEAKWGGVQFPLCYRVTQLADIAQLAEQRTRNAQVTGSTPAIGIDMILGTS